MKGWKLTWGVVTGFGLVPPWGVAASGVVASGVIGAVVGDADVMIWTLLVVLYVLAAGGVCLFVWVFRHGELLPDRGAGAGAAVLGSARPRDLPAVLVLRAETDTAGGMLEVTDNQPG